MRQSFHTAGACTALAILTIGMAVRPANADVLFDSLAGATAGGSIMESAGGYGPLAASFSTGAATATLTDVKLAVFTSNPASGASFSVGLYSDSATSPVSLLDAIATVAENTLSSTVSVVDLTVGTPYVLAANTRYWIELAEPAGSAQWSWTADESGTGVSGESYVYSGSVLPNTDGP